MCPVVVAYHPLLTSGLLEVSDTLFGMMQDCDHKHVLLYLLDVQMYPDE